VRVGKDRIDRLRGSLRAVAGQLDAGLPDSLPILGYGLVTKVPSGATDAPDGPVADLSLVDLLSRGLLAFALEYERESNASLAIGANVLRVLDDPSVRVRDLQRLSGVSREAISMALGFLEKRQLAVVEPDPAGGRGKVVRLTPSGRDARDREPSRRARARRGRASCRAVCRRVAGVRPGAGDAAALPDGAAPWRLSGRQLTRGSGLVRCRVERSDVDLLHAEHRLHGALGAVPVRVAPQLAQRGRSPARTARTGPSAIRTGPRCPRRRASTSSGRPRSGRHRRSAGRWPR
jgi:DNA-binding MarR family transcriptional regulator